MTRWIIGLTAAILGGLDVLLVQLDEPTISAVMADMSDHVKIIPYAWGVLTGHFFLHRSWQGDDVEKRRYPALIASFVGAGVLSFWGGPNWAYLLAGIGAGTAFWPQYKENTNG